MKNILTLSVMAMFAGAVIAAPSVQTQQLGSGVPGASGPTEATTEYKGNLEGLYYAPQYLPGNPTAATIWPRVIDVKCDKVAGGKVTCDGYNWLPEYGRGEYLLIRPVIAEPAPPPPAPAPLIIKKKKAE